VGNFSEYTNPKVAQAIDSNFAPDVALYIKRKWALIHAEMVTQASDFEKADIALTSVSIADPTGLVSVANVFKKPICTPEAAFPTPPANIVMVSQPKTATALIAFDGTYQTANPTNDYHTGRITREGSGYRWTNDAGISWGLSPAGGLRLLTDDANPYKSQGGTHFTFSTSNGTVTGFEFFGGNYYRASQTAPVTNNTNVQPQAAVISYGNRLHIQGKYDNWGAYLDTNNAGCEGNKLCVSAANTNNRDGGGTGTWRIIPAGSAVAGGQAGSPVRYGDEIHIENLWAGGGAWLDTNGGGCEGNQLCVSAADRPDRSSEYTGIWRIVSAAGKPAGTPVSEGEEFYVQNKYNSWFTYLDINGGGCEGNKYCVSASTSPDRAGVGTAVWRIPASQ